MRERRFFVDFVLKGQMLQEQIMKKAWKELTFNVQGKRLIA
jgi:hypothetical protein